MEQPKVIRRDFYLKELIDSRRNGFIKIVTGIRRSGKTFLLLNLFTEFLLNEGVRDDHIIKVNLEDRRNKPLRDPDELLAYIDGKMTDSEMYYILLDEVQYVREFEDVLNSYLHVENAEVYVTGSNSKFLSRDVVTEFRGRGYEIHIYPLSFSEFYGAMGGDVYGAWVQYYKYGGLPQLFTLQGDKNKEEFLLNLHKTVYMKDVIERCKVKNGEEFGELLQIIASSIGSPCNPQKLSNTFKSVKGVTIDPKTIANYLQYMEDAFLIEKAMRYDIKGKKYINTLSKYFFQDIGLRNATIQFNQMEESHIMENVIYNELRSRGFRVNVGVIDSWEKNGEKRNKQYLEVDFVAEMGSLRYYIQSALSIPDREKREQETASLRKIGDGFKRIVIVRDSLKPYFDDNGILYVNLFDFLLNPRSLYEYEVL